MSFFSKMFGKEPKAPSATDAIQKLRETEDMLIKKQEFLESKIEKEIAVAKKNAQKNKRAAIEALKRKKRYEKQLQQLDGSLSTIEMQRTALEGATTNTAVLDSMENAAKAMKAAHKNMDVDQVHDMMDNIAEEQELADEIANAISKPVGFEDGVDDDELEAELAELENEGFEDELKDLPSPSKLPSVPTPAEPVKIKAKATVSKHKDDDDLDKLAAWAN